MTILAIPFPTKLRRDESVCSTHIELPVFPQEINRAESKTFSYKRVRFSIHPTEVIPHIHRKDMTEEERENTWNTWEDIQRIKREVRLTRKLIRECEFNGDNLELSRRGLEIRRRKFMSITKHVVISEQDRQRRVYMNQPMLIASRYGLVCQNASVVARERALNDREELTKMFSPEQIEKEQREGIGYYDLMDLDNSCGSEDSW